LKDNFAPRKLFLAVEIDSESSEKDGFKELYSGAIPDVRHTLRSADILSAKIFPKKFRQKVALVF